MSLKAGGATRVINGDLGDDLAGQMHRRLCQGVRDDLEANFFYLEGDGERVLLVNLDSGGVFAGDFARALREAAANGAELDPRVVLVSSTHTHTGPDVFGLIHDAAVNDAYKMRLLESLREGAREAVDLARPARIGVARGQAHVGYNRRFCWADGTHTMYGDPSRVDFCGLEGPDDPSHAVLCAVDDQDRYIALLQNNACHATCVEQAEQSSADFPGEARRHLRAALGDRLPVLYLQGASGDLSPWDQLRPSHRDRELRLHEIGLALASETLRLLNGITLTADPVVRHAWEDLELNVRLPDPETLARAQETVARGEADAGRWEYVMARGGVMRLHEQFAAHPVDVVPVHALRVGDFALLTNPCELYCQFGLDIKRRSPAAVTAISQLTDGFSGYCPTLPGIMGGGYSAETIYWCRLEPAAGYRIVETSARLLNGLWRVEP